MSNICTINNRACTVNNVVLKLFDPYDPSDLPPNTIRVRTNDGQPPIKGSDTYYTTATLVPGTTDIYDVYKYGNSFERVLFESTNVVEILGANITNIRDMLHAFSNCSNLTTVHLFDTSSVTSMYLMFDQCASLTSVPLFDTSNVTNMSRMFFNCTSLTAIPLFDTSSVTNMDFMFTNCYNVESGALALYQQASTQANPPTNHTSTFYRCGRDTTTGAAELAQIPSDWK